MKSKNYEDSSLALKIPIDDLLDGTQTVQKLETKYKPQPKVTQEFLESENGDSGEPTLGEELGCYRNGKYETKFTTNIEDIFEKQQKDFFASSTKVFSDMQQNFDGMTKVDQHKLSSTKIRTMSGKTTLNQFPSLTQKNFVGSLQNQRPESSSTLGSNFATVQGGFKKLGPLTRPVSAQLLVNHTFQFRNTNKDTKAKKIGDEREVLKIAGREQSSTGFAKKNSYVIKSHKGKVPIGISGYRAAHALTEQEKLKKTKDDLFNKNYPFSPFLTHQIDMNQKERYKEPEGEKDSSTFLSLEHYMYPIGLDEDPIDSH
jgi:hypothetical protein